jgi:hypothetical protein
VAVEHEAPVPVAAPPVAAPEVVAGAPLATDAVLSLQRTAGNQAVCRGIASGVIARAPAPVTSVTVSPSRFTVPVESGTTVKATANAADATWALKDGTAAVTGSSIAADGTITIGGSQPGGTLNAEATSADGTSSYSKPFNVVEKPTTLASSSGSASGTYSATFRHSFTGASGKGSGVERANINEKFDSLSVDTDFGKFTLEANAAGSQGWDLDAAGKMAGDDNVSIDKAGIDANKFVKTASNPTPAKTIPVGFSMTQHLHAKSLPSGNLDAAPFTDTQHVRTLKEDGGALKVVLRAGTKDVAIDYAGPAVFRNAKADKTTVEASEPKPKTGTWKRNEVQVTVVAEPSSAKAKYSITGTALGCTVDSSGKVLIGDQAGTITVRAGDGGSHYDEVAITITARPAPVATPPAPKSTAEGGAEAEPAVVPPGDDAGT